MKRVAKFEKVSFEEFFKAFKNQFDLDDIEDDIEWVKDCYEDVQIPTRSTSGSAGYDYVCPLLLSVKPGDTVVVPTGIRCKMDEGWVHEIYPRSGMGFKYRMRLNNTVGIIDEDYYYSDNEGHIMIKVSNEGDKVLRINNGDKFAQGIFVEYGITTDDDVDTVRNGGFGSTGK